MKIGIAQLNSNDSVESNFNQIKKIILDSESEKPEIIFFPENSLYFRIDTSVPIVALNLQDQVITDLKQLCAKVKISIHFTTAVLDNGSVYNASVFIDTHLNAKIVYKKIHLFDIELTGQKPIRESDTFVNGIEASVTEFNSFKFGNSICYDVRFAELYSQYAKAQVDVILIPAAFLVKTGQAHWEVLLRARAIESQCYVVASAQSGTHRAHLTEHTRETYGHSMVVDPWGVVKTLNTSNVGVIYSHIDHSAIAQVRQQIPMRQHRRIDF
jgi:deaminated glutathione amidase